MGLLLQASGSFAISAVTGALTDARRGLCRPRLRLGYAALVAAPPLTQGWLALLRRLRLGTGTAWTLDQVLWRPLTTAWALAASALLAGLGPRGAAHTVRRRLGGALREGALFWGLVRAVVLRWVPPSRQVLALDLAHALWDLRIVGGAL